MSLAVKYAGCSFLLIQHRVCMCVYIKVYMLAYARVQARKKCMKDITVSLNVYAVCRRFPANGI